MSLEMNVFLEKARVPDRSSWQAVVNSLNIPFELNPDLDPFLDRGFSPSKLKGLNSGFELYSESAKSIVENQPQLVKIIGNRDWCISFRWGGDLSECVCVLTASAGLVKLCDAIAYYPDDDLRYDLDSLVKDANEAIRSLP
jgi:hypothetical protein